jgi:tetrapyrrole methylase family protein/MazG family protein
MLRIVGLGPGDPDLLTLGSREAMRAVGRAVTVLAPPDLVLFLESEGVAIQRGLITDQGLFIRGSSEVIDGFVERIDGSDLALGILGNPLSDFAGLPMLLRALERRRISAEIVPGMPRATLSASVTMPLLPLPPGSSHQNWDDLVQIMSRLRRSCPWDREQTHETLVRYLIEEAYEVVDAIEGNDEAELCEELGDLLFQVVFHAQLATERGKFSVADVIDALSNKMIRRHPHVFGDVAAASVAEVWQNWDQLKSLEPSSAARTSKLDGIPKHMPALQRGQKMQEKAARVGFDWRDARSVTEKLAEELREFADAKTLAGKLAHEDPHVREELGDVLFTVVNLARKLNIDAEGAMRDANAKFDRRFRYMELFARTSGRELNDLSLDELEDLWQAAKTAA